MRWFEWVMASCLWVAQAMALVGVLASADWPSGVLTPLPVATGVVVLLLVVLVQLRQARPWRQVAGGRSLMNAKDGV